SISLPTDDTRLIPLLIAAICATIQLIQLFTYLWKSIKSRSVYSTPLVLSNDTNEGDDDTPLNPSLSRWQKLKNHIQWYGSTTIYVFLVTRFAGNAALLALSAVTLSSCGAHSERTLLMWPWKGYVARCPEVMITATLAYTTSLSLFALLNKRWSTSCARSVNAVLLSLFSVYVYRDVWPLATFYATPEDIHEGPVIWAKVALMTLNGVLVPLAIPRKYSPVDPKNPLTTPNPEQTASILSRLTYSFLDPLIALGYRVPHLGPDQIPPLADYDYAEYQTSTGFVYMDVFRGAKRRHLFFGLLTHFSTSLIPAMGLRRSWNYSRYIRFNDVFSADRDKPTA
ncbi:hypothetical protein CVT24_002723, partial [Panaeolus cyanescens]